MNANSVMEKSTKTFARRTTRSPRLYLPLPIRAMLAHLDTNTVGLNKTAPWLVNLMDKAKLIADWLDWWKENDGRGIKDFSSIDEYFSITGEAFENFARKWQEEANVS